MHTTVLSYQATSLPTAATSIKLLSKVRRRVPRPPHVHPLPTQHPQLPTHVPTPTREHPTIRPHLLRVLRQQALQHHRPIRPALLAMERNPVLFSQLLRVLSVEDVDAAPYRTGQVSVRARVHKHGQARPDVVRRLPTRNKHHQL